MMPVVTLELKKEDLKRLKLELEKVQECIVKIKSAHPTRIDKLKSNLLSTLNSPKTPGTPGTPTPEPIDKIEPIEEDQDLLLAIELQKEEDAKGLFDLDVEEEEDEEDDFSHAKKRKLTSKKKVTRK
ncbi:hypothetical protein HPULCUR_003635 [Helicostylum pulchrum]|uniref:Uncharacterized protein n=1 Tax=Helicostylum pulchrum TaxID=562976 RepID=A0ABP9XV77_9FUNG